VLAFSLMSVFLFPPVKRNKREDEPSISNPDMQQEMLVSHVHMAIIHGLTGLFPLRPSLGERARFFLNGPLSLRAGRGTKYLSIGGLRVFTAAMFGRLDSRRSLATGLVGLELTKVSRVILVLLDVSPLLDCIDTGGLFLY
jgi:hypothetical protein